MRKSLFFLSCSCAFLLVTTKGCQQPSRYDMTPGLIEVVIEGDGPFPEFLVGKWQSTEGDWGFIFEPDGKIFMAKIAMGRTEVRPGRKKVLPVHDGGQAVYIPGDWTVKYSHDHRELTVNIVMNYIRINIGGATLQGKSEDILIGRISEDGRTWHATVYSVPEYEGFPNDPNDLPYTQEVDFVKAMDGT